MTEFGSAPGGTEFASAPGGTETGPAPGPVPDKTVVPAAARAAWNRPWWLGAMPATSCWSRT